jgi:hypothetical protein
MTGVKTAAVGETQDTFKQTVIKRRFRLNQIVINVIADVWGFYVNIWL